MGPIAVLSISFLGPAAFVFGVGCFLVRQLRLLSKKHEEEEPLNEVLTPQEFVKEYGKCYSVDQHVIKVSSPDCVNTEDNGIFI